MPAGCRGDAGPSAASSSPVASLAELVPTAQVSHRSVDVWCYASREANGKAELSTAAEAYSASVDEAGELGFGEEAEAEEAARGGDTDGVAGRDARQTERSQR